MINFCSLQKLSEGFVIQFLGFFDMVVKIQGDVDFDFFYLNFMCYVCYVFVLNEDCVVMLLEIYEL